MASAARRDRETQSRERCVERETGWAHWRFPINTDMFRLPFLEVIRAPHTMSAKRATVAMLRRWRSHARSFQSDSWGSTAAGGCPQRRPADHAQDHIRIGFGMTY